MESEIIFFFKILSIGSFNMQFNNSNNVQNKPVLSIDSQCKKWGNSYLVFNNTKLIVVENVRDSEPIFAGKFDVDKNMNHYLKLFKRINVPGKKADYYIVTILTNTKAKLNNDVDFIKFHDDSCSRIFSSAYHQTENGCESESILIVQNRDILCIDDDKYMFDLDVEQLVKL